jgi:hypothetical protein
MSIPGAHLHSRLPGSRPGTQGRAGTPNSSLARDSSIPGQNRSRMGVGMRKPSNGATFPVPGDSSLKREGEHRECSPPSIPMAGRARERCPGTMERVLPGRIRIRGARARCSSTVWVQTEVCRVCGLHLRAAIRPRRRNGQAVLRMGQRAPCLPHSCHPGPDSRSAKFVETPLLLIDRQHSGT